MRLVNCNFCGNSHTKILYILRDFQLGIPGEFTLVKCTNCGLLFLNPQPTWEELQPYYPEWYDSFLLKYPSFIQRYGMVRRCRVVSKYQRGGRLLDVGCSTGIFLNEMRRSGDWDVYGVEPVAFPARIARERFGLRVFQQTLIEAKLPENYFDVVTWWDVLEHTPNPKECLQETYRILKPGGWVFIQTPDPNSWEAKLFGPYWRGFEAPRHLHIFPVPTLTNQLGLLGFRVRSVRNFAGNLSTTFRSLGYWLDSQGLRVIGSFAHILARSVLCRVVTFPITFLLRHTGQTSSVLYIVQKGPYG